MIQDIHPHRFNRDFAIKDAGSEDIAMYFLKNEVLLIRKDIEGKERLTFPTFKDLEAAGYDLKEKGEYLFAIDDQDFYLIRTEDEVKLIDSFEMKPTVFFREMKPQYMAFAGITAKQINNWKISRAYCGRCGTKTIGSTTERAIVCPKCGMIEYPKISPAIIVAVTDGNRLLMTKYSATRGGYSKYALVAGFVEIGETFEQTVSREVMEEVGLKIKNIRYYKSQPWAFSETEMIGFFAELDGDDTITLDTEELAEGVWFEREDIPQNPSTMSIGQEMIELFRNEKERF